MRPKVPLALVLGLVLGVGAIGSLGLVARADPPPQGYAPDPKAIAATKQWIFRVDVKVGKVALGRVKPKDADKAQATPRVMGRYALELWVGKELLDRARFNVPGAGDGPHEDQNVLKRPQMDRINTHFAVRMADNPRATTLKLVDRATGDETLFAWPPSDDGIPMRIDPPAADAGDGDAGPTTRGDAGAKEPGAKQADAGDGDWDGARPNDAGKEPGGKEASGKDAGSRDTSPKSGATPGPLVPRR